ncbi:NAD-dependent epimerase/dehydratase family protein [Celerinatantimonas yamalensis]|uniref:NAD-dependent epimerase/dehydratase family protein n=1 Tax=Celerinatantimonas yamalensis TaxID=559956 RepID=A0ABW9G191_9GAMM
MKRIFVTRATGFIGQAIVKNRLDNHYDIVGLARNESSAAMLENLGASTHRVIARYRFPAFTATG